MTSIRQECQGEHPGSAVSLRAVNEYFTTPILSRPHSKSQRFLPVPVNPLPQ